ncbi:T9SS type A sorting domain-containing protein [Bacteroidota bacterium]
MKNATFLLLFIFISNLFAEEPVLLWQNGGQEFETNSMIYSNDGIYLFISVYKREAGSESNSLQMWNVDEKKLIKEIPCTRAFDDMDISPDNKLIIGANRENLFVEVVNIADSKTTVIKDVATNNIMFPSIKGVAFSADGSSIYVYESSYIKLQSFNALTLEKASDIDLGNLKWIQFSEDGSLLSSVNNDTTVSVWELETWTEILRIKFENASATNTSISMDNKYLIVNHDSTIRSESIELYSIETGEILNSNRSQYRYPYSAIANDNKTILTSTFPIGELDVWNIETDEINYTEIEIYGPDMICSPTDFHLAGRDFISNVGVYDLNSLESIFYVEPMGVENFYNCYDIEFVPGGQTVLACGSTNPQPFNSGKIKAYNLLNGDLINTLNVSQNALTNVCISNDGKKIAAAEYYYNIYLINYENPGNPVIEKTFKSDCNFADVLFSKDETRIIAAGNKSGIRYINSETGEIREFDTNGYDIQSIALNSDESKLIFGTKEKMVRVMEYNPDNDEYIGAYTFYPDQSTNPNTRGISYVGFSDDDKFIIVCASDKKTYLYDAETYEKINSFEAMLPPYSNSNISAAITHDNNYLFVANAPSILRMFDIKTGQEIWTDDTLKSIFEFQRPLNSIRLSDDNKYLAYCSAEGSLGMYEVDLPTDVDIKEYEKEMSIYPNPIIDKTTIEFRTAEIACITITITNALGQEVALIANNELYSPGIHQLKFDAGKLPSGIYYCTLKTGMLSETVKLIITK